MREKRGTVRTLVLIVLGVLLTIVLFYAVGYALAKALV